MTITGASSLILDASGGSGFGSNGGTVDLTTTSGPLNLGAAKGQVQINIGAMGANGGSANVIAGGDLTLSSNGIFFGTPSPYINGPNVLLQAGFSGGGALTINETINTSTVEQGGNITLIGAAGPSSPITINNDLIASGTGNGGQGGTITILTIGNGSVILNANLTAGGATKGGTIQIAGSNSEVAGLANLVLNSGATLNVSGLGNATNPSSGGTIAINVNSFSIDSSIPGLFADALAPAPTPVMVAALSLSLRLETLLPGTVLDN